MQVLLRKICNLALFYYGCSLLGHALADKREPTPGSLTISLGAARSFSSSSRKLRTAARKHSALWRCASPHTAVSNVTYSGSCARSGRPRADCDQRICNPLHDSFRHHLP